MSLPWLPSRGSEARALLWAIFQKTHLDPTAEEPHTLRRPGRLHRGPLEAGVHRRGKRLGVLAALRAACWPHFAFCSCYRMPDG